MEESRSVNGIKSIYSLLIFRIIAIVLFFYLLKTEKIFSSFYLLIFIAVIESSAVFARSGIRKLEAGRSLYPVRVFPGEKAELRITIKNNKFIPSRLGWFQSLPPAFTVVNGKYNSGPDCADNGKVFIEGHGSSEINIKFTANKRGYYELSGLLLQSQDLLGLFVRDKYIKDPLSLIVYPKLANLKYIGFNRTDFSGLRREERPYLFDPIMFAGLREYTSDMPAKSINWKASAHKDVLLSRIVESSSNMKILIAIDLEPIMLIGDEEECKNIFEEALSVAAAIAVKADERRIPFGLIGNFPGFVSDSPTIIPVNRSDTQNMIILEALARAEYKVKGILEELINAESLYIPWGTSLIEIGEFPLRLLPSQICQVYQYPLSKKMDLTSGAEKNV